MTGSTGADTLDFSASTQSWDLRAGDDVGGNILIGGGGADNLVSGLGADTLRAMPATTASTAPAATDIVDGGEGDDWLVGGLETTRSLGGGGADTIQDAAEKDVCGRARVTTPSKWAADCSLMVGWLRHAVDGSPMIDEGQDNRH